MVGGICTNWPSLGLGMSTGKRASALALRASRLTATAAASFMKGIFIELLLLWLADGRAIGTLREYPSHPYVRQSLPSGLVGRCYGCRSSMRGADPQCKIGRASCRERG